MDAFFESWPLWAQAALVVFLLALSGFFSMAETSMVASNRHRLRAMANAGHAGAALTQKLLKRLDTLLSVLLIANNLINTILPILVTGIALHLFGTNGLVLSIATLTIAFCLDTEKNSKGRLIDINTLMYVALHEVSHIATKSVGHNDEFWNNFKFMITEAKAINIYNPVDYKKQPARYCGMNITDNPYYDVK